MAFDKDASRRAALKTGLALLAGGLLASTAAQAQGDSDDKVDQDTVQYQTTPKDGQKCSICANYVAPNACKVVKGTISPEGWCAAFAPKGS